MSKLALTFPGTEKVSENLSELPGDTPLTFNKALVNAQPADIINLVLPLVFVVAGLILFAMLVAGGLTIFLSGGNPEKMKQGQTRIVHALTGFAIIFAAYWIVQLVGFSLGLTLL